MERDFRKEESSAEDLGIKVVGMSKMEVMFERLLNELDVRRQEEKEERRKKGLMGREVSACVTDKVTMVEKNKSSDVDSGGKGLGMSKMEARFERLLDEIDMRNKEEADERRKRDLIRWEKSEVLKNGEAMVLQASVVDEARGSSMGIGVLNVESDVIEPSFHLEEVEVEPSDFWERQTGGAVLVEESVREQGQSTDVDRAQEEVVCHSQKGIGMMEEFGSMVGVVEKNLIEGRVGVKLTRRKVRKGCRGGRLEFGRHRIHVGVAGGRMTFGRRAKKGEGSGRGFAGMQVGRRKQWVWEGGTRSQVAFFGRGHRRSRWKWKGVRRVQSLEGVRGAQDKV